jgi:hypothetical protein
LLSFLFCSLHVASEVVFEFDIRDRVLGSVSFSTARSLQSQAEIFDRGPPAPGMARERYGNQRQQKEKNEQKP